MQVSIRLIADIHFTFLPPYARIAFFLIFLDAQEGPRPEKSGGSTHTDGSGACKANSLAANTLRRQAGIVCMKIRPETGRKAVFLPQKASLRPAISKLREAKRPYSATQKTSFRHPGAHDFTAGRPVSGRQESGRGPPAILFRGKPRTSPA